MTWGAITYNGVGRLHFLSGRLNTEGYIGIIQNHYLGTLRDHELDVSEVIFQQDNASMHVSAGTRNYLSAKGIVPLTWPPQSPDMNIIENVWGDVDRRLRKRQLAPKTITELINAIKEE